jgi:hypothetical protein
MNAARLGRLNVHEGIRLELGVTVAKDAARHQDARYRGGSVSSAALKSVA